MVPVATLGFLRSFFAFLKQPIKLVLPTLPFPTNINLKNVKRLYDEGDDGENILHAG
jgi:hypothetical protein